MRAFFEFLSVFDWIGPVVGLWQDSVHFATGVHNTFDISIEKGDLSQAKAILRKSSHNGEYGPTTVVSTTMTAFESDAMITIECYGGEDGYGSVREAMDKLAENGISCWVYPGWA